MKTLPLGLLLLSAVPAFSQCQTVVRCSDGDSCQGCHYVFQYCWNNGWCTSCGIPCLSMQAMAPEERRKKVVAQAIQYLNNPSQLTDLGHLFQGAAAGKLTHLSPTPDIPGTHKLPANHPPISPGLIGRKQDAGTCQVIQAAMQIRKLNPALHLDSVILSRP